MTLFIVSLALLQRSGIEPTILPSAPVYIQKVQVVSAQLNASLKCENTNTASSPGTLPGLPFQFSLSMSNQHPEFWWEFSFACFWILYTWNHVYNDSTCDLFCSALHTRFIPVAVHSFRSFILILPFWMHPNLLIHPTVDSQSMRKLMQYQEEGQDLLVK